MRMLANGRVLTIKPLTNLIEVLKRDQTFDLGSDPNENSLQAQGLKVDFLIHELKTPLSCSIMFI